MPLRVLLWLVLAGQALSAWAGGSGLNLVVVVNQNSPNSVRLGNDYCEKRGVPPQNLFRMTGWTGGAVSWTLSQFETNLRDPLLARLASASLTNQVQYVLLSMDIPYRVQDGASANSTSSVLFYGFKTNSAVSPGIPDTCSLPGWSSNSYAFSESPFLQARPNTADTNGFLALMLTDHTLDQAEQILNRALASDSSFPAQAVYLEKTSDADRNVRFFSFDNAVFDNRIRGDVSVVRINSDATAFSGIRGLQTGLANLGLPADAFLPGGLGDSLTSYAGDLFENSGQTSLLAFLNAGAAASYGTVIEPCNFLQKFPDPLVFFYQGRGFCTAEAYYQSVLNPYQGLFVGDPLCAPFAQPGQANWDSLTNGTILQGQSSLPAAVFLEAAADLPMAQIDLFIDGVYSRTLTNIPPAAGNLLTLTLNGSTIRYTAPNNSSLGSLTAGLAAALNNQSNLTRVAVFPTGDRLELESLDEAAPGSNVLLSATASAGTAPLSTVFPTPARRDFLDSVAAGYHGLTVSNFMAPGDWLQLLITKTNGAQVSLSVTNGTAETNLETLCQSLMNAINSDPALQGPDGVLAADLYPDTASAIFFLYARSPGWAAAQVQAVLNAAPDLLVLPPGAATFEDNLTDVRPRNHLYLSAGLPQVSTAFVLDTTRLADGYHRLTLVGYDGTSLRTQTQVSRDVLVQNNGLSATLGASSAGTNFTVDAPLSISVNAGTNGVSQIELFSTGGSLGIVSNQPSALFNIPTVLLGAGLHPFYALVTDALGNQFRTQPLLLRFIPSLQVNISSQPLALSWATEPGLTYNVLSSTSLTGAFQPAATVLASGTSAQWAVPVSPGPTTFFRIQLIPGSGGGPQPTARSGR